jgi:nicotinamide mononucleotide transporter
MTDNPANALAQAALAMSPLEVIAVVLGILYLLLAMRESLWCWPTALVSTAIFFAVFWRVQLVMESALQVYYMVMAVYGWWHWRHSDDNGTGNDTPGGKKLAISRWGLQQHLLALACVLTLSAGCGLALQYWTEAALPFLDSFTTWGSVLTTWMVARKILENWLYWLLIDSISIYLYLDRGLTLTAVLFMAYLVIALFGYRQWLKNYRLQSS